MFSVISFGGYLSWLSGEDELESLIKKNETKAEVFDVSEYTFYDDLQNEKYTGIKESSSKSISKSTKQANVTNKYFIQVGSFSDHSNADQVKAELTLMDVEQVIIERSGTSDLLLYQVSIGPFSSYSLAISKALFLKQQGYASIILKRNS
jgi:cell division protein FtsN